VGLNLDRRITHLPVDCWDGCGDRVLCFPCAEVFALSKVAWL